MTDAELRASDVKVSLDSSEEEKLDQEGTIVKLVAELEILADEYVEPLPVFSKLEEVAEIELDSGAIAQAKADLLAQREVPEPE